LTTRSIGIMIMIHGDDKGLVLPPKVAPTQVVIIPIYKKNHDDETVRDYCKSVTAKLKHINITCVFDDRGNHTPGYLFSDWEMKGTPFQFRIGPKEVTQKSIYCVRRDGQRSEIKFDNLITFGVEIDKYQTYLLENARVKLNQHTKKVTKWDHFVKHLDKGNMLLAPWCEQTECEEWIKQRSMIDSCKDGSAKSLCIPFDQGIETEEKCINYTCKHKSKVWCLFARSY